uniref:Histidine ABC transporter, permease protein HisQ (TC 3.A.1.3.1) n=1 Tax=uncultured Thiotrichaceae bacterium TaxID=298394 RepID=A0A6S6T9B3_9GAMM|nr:MAG: Histidine ABC transporter, permease protein HisQ (TC 3.A.1.3.1) [uncultured Thiotrichaceae bacterium]
MAGAYGKLYGGPLTRDLPAIYTTVVRSVPELVLILILYFVGTDLINQLMSALDRPNVEINGVAAGIWVPGFMLSVPPGLAQAAGPWYLAAPARSFCTVIRGTPLLLQIWLLYFGLGSLFPQFPWIRYSEFWPYLRETWPYALVALTFSYAVMSFRWFEGRTSYSRTS